MPFNQEDGGPAETALAPQVMSGSSRRALLQGAAVVAGALAAPEVLVPSKAAWAQAGGGGVEYINTSTFILIGPAGLQPYFIEGTPTNWHVQNNGVHTLVVPGVGAVRFVDGQVFTNPQATDPLERTWWAMALKSPQGPAASTFHDGHAQELALIDLVTGAFGLKTVSSQGSTHSWEIDARLRDGASWVRQAQARPGEALVLFHDTSWYGPNAEVELILIKEADAWLQAPTALASQSVRGTGTTRFTMPVASGGYLLKSRIGGKAVLSHGRILVQGPVAAMPPYDHIHSIAAAISGVKVHLALGLMHGGMRTLWHFSADYAGASGQWKRVDDPRQPMVEIEMVILPDGRPMMFALDETGFVHTRTGEGAWSAAPEGSQLVPFAQLSSNPQAGTPSIYAVDQTGGLWRSALGGTGQWSDWTYLPAQPSGVQPTSFTDFAAAGSRFAAVDGAGYGWVSRDGRSWIPVRDRLGKAAPAYVSVDITLGPDGRTSKVWLVDRQGVLWFAAVAPGAAAATVQRASAGPPVPLSEIFCAVAFGHNDWMWGTSNQVELWGGVEGSSLWDGPTWRGLRAVGFAPVTSVAPIVPPAGTPNAPRLALTAVTAVKPGAGADLWRATLDGAGAVTDWNGWSQMKAPVQTAGLRRLAAAQSGASHLWALAMDGGLHRAPYAANPSALAWTKANGITARSVAAARLPNGSQAVWVLDAQGRMKTATEADQFIRFTDAAFPPGVVEARQIAAVDTGQGATARTLVMGVDARSGLPFYQQQDGGQAPRFWTPTPSTSMPTRIQCVALGTQTTDGSQIMVLALDGDGWLWSVAETASGWGSALWSGPRALGQPAQFRDVQAARGWLFGVDSLGRLWAYAFAARTWYGPDWLGASSLASAWQPTRSALAAHHAPRTAMSALETVHTSKTTLRTLPPFAIDNNAATTSLNIDNTSVSTTFALLGPRDFTYLVRGPDGSSYPNSRDTKLYGSDSAYRLPGDRRKGVIIPIRPPSGTDTAAVGAFTLRVRRQEGVNTWDGLVGYAYQRAKPAIPQGFQETDSKLTLKINPIYAWTPGLIGEDKDDLFRRVEDARVLLRNFFWNVLGIELEFGENKQTELSSPIVYSSPSDFSSGELRDLLRLQGVTDGVNLIWTPQISGTRKPRGVSGGLPGMPFPDNEGFGVVVALRAARHDLNSRSIYLSAAHEIGHLLGLSHQSSDEKAGNLMRASPEDYGESLNPSQIYILKNAALVKERVTAQPTATTIVKLNVLVHTSRDGGGWFDGPGTDGDVRLIIMNKRATAELVSVNLDDSENNFEAGFSDSFTIRLDQEQQFHADDIGEFRIQFSPAIFDNYWKMEWIEINGYAVDGVKFDFHVFHAVEFTDSNPLQTFALNDTNFTRY